MLWWHFRNFFSPHFGITGGKFSPLLLGLTGIGGNEATVEAENRHVRVDEDGFLLAATRVEEFEEGGEEWITKVVALMVGQEDGADGPKMRAGVLDFFDTGCMWVTHILVAGVDFHWAILLTIVGRRVAGRWHRKRICLGKFAPSDGAV